MLRFLPLGAAFATMATEVGRQSETAIPCMARNMTNSIPVRAKPHTRMKTLVRKQPSKLTRLVPITSAMEPASSKQELLVKLQVVVSVTVKTLSEGGAVLVDCGRP